MLQVVLAPKLASLLRHVDAGLENNGGSGGLDHQDGDANARQTKDFIKFLGLVAILYLGQRIM